MIWPVWQYPHCGTSSAIHACCNTCRPLAPRPSMVVMFFPETCDTGVEHERIGAPSTCTVQAPHKPARHPNFVPVSSSVSRRTQSRGVSGDTLTLFSLPFTRSVTSAMLVQSRWSSLFVRPCFATWTTIVLKLRKNGNGTQEGAHHE